MVLLLQSKNNAMSKKIKGFIYVFLSIVILFIGYSLRSNYYDTVPFPGESVDEYSNSWVGLSLLRLGKPVGISNLSSYPNEILRYINVDRIYQRGGHGGPIPLFNPWFDHPPLLGLITGGYAYLKGARSFEDTISVIIRKPMIYLGTFTLLSLMIYAYICFGPLTSLASGLIYATSPLIVISSRMIQAENGYTPIFLVALILLKLYETKDKEIFLWLAALLSAVGILFKIPGLMIAITCIVLLMTQSKKSLSLRCKESFIVGAVAISGLIIFITYGIAYDNILFKTIFLTKSNRIYEIGFQAFFNLISTTKITNSKYIMEGWPLLGWLSLWALSVKIKSQKIRYLLFPTIICFSVYILVGSTPYGWYRIPFMPFLFIAIGYFIVTNRKSITGNLISIIGLIIPTGVTLYKLYENAKISPTNVWRYSLTLIIFSLLSAVIFNNKSHHHLLNKITQLVVLAILLFTVALSIKFNSLITLDYWYQSD